LKTGTLQNNEAYQINVELILLVVWLFSIPIVKTPRKTKIMHFTKQQNNVQAFSNLHIRRIILFCRQYFLQEVFARFYFLGKITTEKPVILEVIRGFIFYSSILLQLSDHMLFIIEKILPTGADVQGGTCRTILADWMNTRDFLAD